MNVLRTLIVDDEMPARIRMHAMLEERNDIEIVAECQDGNVAVATIENLRPDLVFLDIQMPELDGFEVIQNLASSRASSIVFVSAYSEYAVKAFEVHALDYLLKPFNAKRLDAAIQRVKSRRHSNESRTFVESQDAAQILQKSISHEPGDRIALKCGGRLHLVEISRIVCIEAARNYVRVHANGKQYLLRESMKNLEQRLEPSRFIRIHRSAIINVDCVESLEPTVHGDYRVFLTDGSVLPLSRNYKSAMQARFGDQI